MGFRLRLPSSTQISRWTIYALFAGLFITLPAGVLTAPKAFAAACNPTSTIIDTQTVITFASVGSCEWTVPNGVSAVRVLVVGGGSSGGAGQAGVWWPQGGGGAVVTQLNFATSPGATVDVVVGAGGAAITTQGAASTSVNNGEQSKFSTLTANGGVAPVNTLAAGGASGNGNAGGGTSGGAASGGGGGAGAAGSGLNGGAGVNSNITGAIVMYGSGGAGANSSSGTASSGGGSNGNPPLENRGGGGSQPSSGSGSASAGGSGVVIVRYTTPINLNPMLTFNANGGTGSVTARSETAGVTITLPSGTSLTKRNSVATGWNTAANGSGTPYAFGDPYTFSANQILYAQWSGPILATDLASPQCVAGVGVGGPNASTAGPTLGGNGCVVVEYLSSGVQAFKSFNYTGANQSWTVPSGVTSVIFYLIGAGGGGSWPTGTGGGGAGFSKGQLGVNAGDVFTIIVGQAGGGVAPTVSGSCYFTPVTYGGGGRGGACAQNGYPANTRYMASGGGRSAVRHSTGTEDLLTAAGGGGGSYGGQGGAGGGLTGVNGGAPNPGLGGTQRAGGTGGASASNGLPGYAGTKYQGGDSRDDSGGGGGGYYGGGGGGDNGGGGGGSSYIDTRTVTNAVTSAGAITVPGTSTGLFNIITYDGNGATGGAVPSPTQFTVTGGSRSLETNTAALARTGFVLTGWNTLANGRGTSYPLGFTAFSTSADVTLFAQWSYRITYNANGATSGTAPASQIITGDSTTTLAINPGVLAITRGALRGWNTEADGSGTAYPGGQTNFSNNGNITLYAMWGPATCTPAAGYSNCAVFPMSQQDLFYTLPNSVPVGTLMQAEIWGAGGGVNESSPTGGGGGGYSRVQIEVKAVGETFTVVTGKGGSRGDTVGTYGGGGGTSRSSYWGSSGGGMSGLFSGEGLDTPIVISGGGGGASPGHAVGIAGGGGAAGNSGNQRGNASDYSIAGAPGTLIAGGAAATNTSPCDSVNATAGSRYQGGRGAGANTANGTETGGGGGGGYFGGGGGRCQTSGGPVQNGGGGGGSGYLDSSRVRLVEVVNGSNAIAGAGPTGGTTSAQYITGIGLGGGIGNSGAAGDGLVVLQWGTETYTVTFSGNNGTSTAPNVSQSVVGGTVTVADSSTATRTGYSFLGWNTLASGLGTNVAVGPGYFPPSNITLYAKWSANSYVVIFDSNTATGVGATGSTLNMTIVAGTAKALTTNGFSRAGYVFRNWNSRADGTGTSYANLASVTFFETTTVYAQWNPILTYNINGGAGSVPVAVNNPPGTAVRAPTSTITRSGFVFAGWNSAANRGGTSYLVGDSITVTVPTTVYAMWNLTVSFNINGGTTGSVPASIISNEYAFQTIPGNPGNIFKASSIFVGWNTLANGLGTRYLAGDTITATADLILYVNWLTACSPTTTYGNGDKVNTFGTVGTCAFLIPAGVTSIDFLTVGGGGGGGSNVGQGGAGGGLVYKTNISVTAGQVVIVTTGAAGTVAAAGGASSITIGGTKYDATGGAGGGTYVVGRLCATARTVGGVGEYANGASGGNGSSGSDIVACVGGAGTSIGITGTSTIYGAGGGGGGYSAAAGLGGNGVVGSGAGNGGNNIAGTAGAANRGGGGGGGGAGSASGGAGGSGVNVITFDYISTVTYDSNTATSGSISTTTWTQNFVGEQLTIQDSGTLAKLGFSFTGWNTAANGLGTSYQPGTVLAPQGNTTYYAIWVADTFTVIFNANNGTGSIANQLYTAGIAQALTNNNSLITRTGFTFAGWATAADGSGTSYTNSQSITLYAGVTLYAKWTANTYAVTFGSNNANGSTLPSGAMPNQNFSAGTPFNLSTSVWYKTGYDFIGWSTATGVQAITYTQNQSVTLYANTTVYAQFTAQIYAITYSNNGGSGIPSVASQNYTYGSAAITSFATIGAMTRTGYTFGGWATTAAGTTALTTLTPVASQTLYAIWTPRAFNIVFNGNTSTSGSILNLAMVSGTSKALTANAFLKTGFRFTGWNTFANGSGISYVDTQTITLFSDTSTVIIFAQWSALRPATPTLTAVAGNETATITISSSAAGTALTGAVESYTVTALDASGNPVPGPLTCTVTPPATSCVIEGLTNGTAYKFSVVASNTTGSSATAVTSSSVTPQPWVVTYSVVNGGTVSPATANFDIGSPVTLPLPVRAGYTFTGWFTAASGGTLLGLNGSGYSPPSSITVYAQWAGIAYPITYNSNGGTSTVPADGSYATGGASYPIAAAPGGMTKVGYTFAGWNTLSTGLGTDFAAAAPYSTSAALTLFAKWNAVDYTITYGNSGSGTGTVPTHPAINIGQTFAVASGSALLNPGYTFTGWFDGTNTYVSGESYTVASTSISFTAVWTALQYLVIYSVNGGTGTAPAEGTRSSGQTFTVASGSALLRTGYLFAGWSESSTAYAAGDIFTMPTRNVTLVAQWTPEVFTVTYVAGLGTGNASRVTDAFAYGGSAISLPAVGNMAYPGYVFNAWAETSTVISGAYTPARSETLTAQWIPGTYAITYNTNGATGSPTGAASTYTTSQNGLTVPSSIGMTNLGYTLAGWSTTPNGSVISGAFSPTANTTLYAIWTPAQVDLNFLPGEVSAGTASGAAISTTSLTRAFDSQYTLPAIDSLTVTISTQVYAFTGWKANNGVIYAPGSAYTVEAAGTTFTARWIQQFVVIYVLNGGTAYAGDLATDVQCVSAGNMCSDQQIIATNNTPTRDGYTFTGWLDQGGTTVGANSPYTVAVNHYVLSAQWTPVSVNVVYAVANGDSTPATQTQSYLGSINLAAAITRTGYTFAGWSDGTLTYGAGANYRVESSSAITLTALWTSNIHSVSYDLNRGTSGTPLSSAPFNFGATVAITPIVPLRTGYNFAGWLFGSTTYESTTAFAMPDLDVTFTAKWSAQTFPVTYALSGGNSSLPTQSAVAFGSTFTVATAPTNPDSTVTFLGWSDGTNIVAAGSTYTMPANGISLTAQWSGALVGVTYVITGATSGAAPATEIVPPSTEVTVASGSGISKDRFVLDGWSTGNTTVEPSSTIAPVVNTTLVAVWVAATPDAPIDTPTATNGAVTIAVGPGSGSGGVPTSYTVTAIDSASGLFAGTCTVISPATSCTIAGLTNGTPYRFSTVATNSSGTSAATITAPVTPATVPSAPTSPVATVENGQATVSFTAPANTAVGTGGSPITSYSVTAYAPDGITVVGTCTATSPATSCLITGLTNGVAYTYGVVANNAAGSSPSSTKSAPVTPATVPGAPATVTASPATATTATINIGAATVTGGSAITAYDITATPVGGGTPITLTVTAAQISGAVTLTGLAPGTQYTITSNATNVVGDGAMTTAGSAITTPAAPPGPPSIAAASATSATAATITISAPVSNGGATITRYTTTLTPLGGGNAIVETSTGTTVSPTSLAPGTTYRVTTVATNSSGDGTTSTTSTFTTPLEVTTSTGSSTGLVGSAIAPISTSISGASPTNTTYSVTGALPAGLSLDSATGIITGTPTIAVASATYTVTATTTVAGGATATGSATLTLGVSPTVPGAPASVSATATAATTASITVGAATYNGGATIDSYTVTVSPVVSGAVGTASPLASAIGSAVNVSGLTPGTEYTVSVVATNAAGSGAATTSVTTIITPSALTPSTSTTNGSVGNAITPITIAVTASGAISTVFSITGPLPSGLTLDTTTGTISGASTVAINPTQFTITAITTLASGATTTGTSVITLGVSPVAPSAPAAATANVPTGSSTTATIVITAPTSNGGDLVDTYTVTATPVLAGVPVTTTSPSQSATLTGLAPGTQYTAVVTATNSAGTGPSTTTSTFITNPVISLSSSSVSATVNSPMTAVTTNLGTEAGATAVYSISGTLPAGLSFDTATGTISGTPTTIATASSYTITAAVTIAGVVLSASESVTVSVIAAVPTAPLAAVPSVPTGSTTTATLAITAPASNGGANVTGYSITVIAVATGTTISETSTTTNPTLTGLAAGTEYIAAVAAINSSGIGATNTTASFVTNPGLTISTASTTGAVGSAITPITTTLLAQAGTTATYSISGTLPAGLNFDISTGVISGTPTETSTLTTYTITATASIGGNAVTASVDVSIGVSNSLQANLVLSGSNATVGTPVTLSLSGGSGTGAITYAITGGSATGCAVTSSGSLTATGAGTCIVTATREGDNTYATAVSNVLTITFTAVSAPAPTPVAPTPSAPAPNVVTPTPTPTPSPSASPTAKPTPSPSASTTAKPTPSPSASPKPSPSASPKPTTSPKPTASPKATPKPSATPTSTLKATPSASSSPEKKPLEIAPPKNSKGSSKSSVTVNNIKPGQKIKVTVVEGNSLPSPKPTSKVKATPKPTASSFKVTSNAPTKVNPKPSGNSAGFGVNNLKPGQKIKVTIKTGGTKK